MKKYIWILFVVICLCPLLIAQSSDEGEQALENDEQFRQKMEAESKKHGLGLPDKKAAKIPSAISDKKKSKLISRYLDQAAKNYQGILDSRPQREVENTSNRIRANHGLLKNNSQKLSVSENSLRRLKLEYIRRFLVIKNAYRKKHFDKATYDREMEKLSKDYEHKVRALANDVKFYRKEVNKTKKRLGALKEMNRINKIMNYRNNKTNAKPSKKKKLTELEKMMQRLQAVGGHKMKEFWNAPDRK